MLCFSFIGWTQVTLKTSLTEDYPIEMTSLKAYIIYINASVDPPDTIAQVNLLIDGNSVAVEQKDNYFYYLWTPDTYGSHQIEISASSNNGDTANLTRNVQVVSTALTQTVTTLQDVVIEFGGTNSRWYYGSYTLPQYIDTYNVINASLEVECPNINGGCDDWDRWAHIDIKAPDGNWIQLIRYITPYGVGCNHQLDVTDYASLLQGEVEFRVFIDTWGTGGWQLTLNLEYQQGTPDYNYSSVVEVWDDSYPFGDPSNLQPVPQVSINLPSQIQDAYLRLSNTGHGWGQNNTSNAAEFFNAYHFIDINGTQTYTQHLWTDCNPNPDSCTGQQGTWYYNRAGWCPGAISPPDIYNLTSYIGNSFDLHYRFHPSYQDFCHPNNPNCVSGSTCPDCNDGYNPVYYVDGQVIIKSNTPLVYNNSLNINNYDNTLVYAIEVFPNPSTGVFKITSDDFNDLTRVTINSITGELQKAYYFKTSSELNNYTFNVKNLSEGVYFINIENNKGTGTKKIIIKSLKE